MAVLTILMCFASTSVFAQEVRGIETRKVSYVKYNQYNSAETWWGYEFHNANSISVSVDIELYRRPNINEPERLVYTKTIVLKPDEKYVFKNESDVHFRIEDDFHNWYFIKYKAYKLQ